MEHFREEYSQLLLDKEWLVKVDSETAKPYLFKYTVVPESRHPCFIITDTRQVWAEILTLPQMLQRWQICNPDRFTSFFNSDQDRTWQDRACAVLSTAHTLGSISEANFEIVPSNHSDLGFRLEFEPSETDSSAWAWRWETISVGPKMSADILSRHLIMPLITSVHTAFHSGEALCEQSEADLERTVDRVCRTARRSLDTHIKHVISKPRVATTLRRITAMLNARDDVQPIVSDVERPYLAFPSSQIFAMRQDPASPAESMPVARSASQAPAPQMPLSPPGRAEVATAISPELGGKPARPRTKLVRRARAGSPALAAGSELSPRSANDRAPNKDDAAEDARMNDAGADSMTEEENVFASAPASRTGDPNNGAGARDSLPPAAAAPGSRRLVRRADSKPAAESSSDSAPAPPKKKAKTPASSGSDEDSEAERRRHVAQLVAGGAPSRRGGARQPIKRGAKRF